MRKPAAFTPRTWTFDKRTLTIGSAPVMMGILNVTPDSFSDGGDFTAVNLAVSHALKMVEEGAEIIDVGGESTRPGASFVDPEEEIRRVVPVIEALVQAVDIPISVDTYKASVARAALDAGAHLVNDVWGLQKDPEMAGLVAERQVPAILMHNQEGTAYPEGLMEGIKAFFEESLRRAKEAGVSDESIVLDPGIGFGKTAEQNLYLMKHLEELLTLGYPLLLGTSRKSMIGKVLDVPPKERVSGTVATSVLGYLSGASIFRVHDVRENREALAVARAILRSDD